MIRSADDLKGFKLNAQGEEIGKIEEFYFDDHTWTVRYVVVNTGSWLVDRLVLISPHSFETPDWDEKVINVNLTKDQVENSPSIDTDKPVSRQHENYLSTYYGWPTYWMGFEGYYPGAIPPGITPPRTPAAESDLTNAANKDKGVEEGDPNLRSTREVDHYNIHASDDSIGHVDDFLIDDSTWEVRYLVVDTRNWLPGGKKVILSPKWIKSIDWDASEVRVEMTKEQIKNSPEFDSAESLNREYESDLYGHYDKKIYW